MRLKGKKTPVQQLKSEIAKARKESVRLEREQQKIKELEDRKWIERDKLVLRKMERQHAKKVKREEQQGRKALSKFLLETELVEYEEKLNSKSKKNIVENEANQINDDEENIQPHKTKKIIIDRPELFVNLNRYQSVDT